MSEDTQKNTPAETQKNGPGGMVFLVIGLLIVASVVALAFVSNTVIADPEKQASAVQEQEDKDSMSSDMAQAEETEIAPASGEPEQNVQQEPEKEKQVEIKEGNPVVARIGDEEITRMDVLKFIAQLPVQMRQQPIEDLFPLALEQTINARLLEREASKLDLSQDEEVKKQIAETKKAMEEQLKEAEKNIVRTAYVQQLVNEGVTEDALKAEYDEYVTSFKPEEEVRARHILLQTKEEADEAIKKLDEGADFEELAKELSTGPSAADGGDLGYFVKGQMVPEFSDAAFGMKVGEYTKEPVQTQFGFHVIKVEDRRESEPLSMEEVKPYIEQELKRNVLDETLQQWRKDMAIETFDINGDPVETSSTSEKSPEKKG